MTVPFVVTAGMAVGDGEADGLVDLAAGLRCTFVLSIGGSKALFNISWLDTVVVNGNMLQASSRPPAGHLMN